MMTSSLAKQIKFADDEAHPYGTAVIQRRELDNWARKAELNERTSDRWKTTAHIFAAVIVGLLIALMYASQLFAAPPAPVERCAADVLQLDPETIRGARSGTVEI